jgi:hypothetical protein
MRKRCRTAKSFFILVIGFVPAADGDGNLVDLTSRDECLDWKVSGGRWIGAPTLSTSG